MAVQPLITQDDIEKRFGPLVLVQFTDDDGDQVADPGVVQTVILDASNEGAGILRGAWKLDEIVELVASDPAVQRDFVMIAMGMLGERRPAITDPQGNKMYFKDRTLARERLELLRDTELRSTAEGAGAPVNPKVKIKTNVERTRRFTFAPTESNGRGYGSNGPGGM